MYKKDYLYLVYKISNLIGLLYIFQNISFIPLSLKKMAKYTLVVITYTSFVFYGYIYVI